MSESSNANVLARSHIGDCQASAHDAKAVLFCRLAKLVVWGQQHRDVGARYPEFDALVSDALAAMAHAGSREEAAARPPRPEAFPESENFSPPAAT